MSLPQLSQRSDKWNIVILMLCFWLFCARLTPPFDDNWMKLYQVLANITTSQKLSFDLIFWIRNVNQKGIYFFRLPQKGLTALVIEELRRAALHPMIRAVFIGNITVTNDYCSIAVVNPYYESTIICAAASVPLPICDGKITKNTIFIGGPI